jgi:hypothetical protein
MAYVVNLATHLVIDGVPLSTPAWEHTNLYDLFGAAKVRGDNLVMPGAVGVRPLRRRPTETPRTINITVFGDRAPDGTAQTDPIAGLHANLDALFTNVVDPLVTPNSTRTAIIVLPSTTLTAQIQVLGFEIVEALNPGTVNASMDVTIIEGQFR